MTQPQYMAEEWFQLFKSACESLSQQAVARRLGVSGGMVSQVLRGTGAYGSGQASTAKFAKRVQVRLGRFECPFLTQEFREPRLVTADDCRRHGHSEAAISSYLQGQHWRACQTCQHFASTAPPPPPPESPPARRKSRVTSSPPPHPIDPPTPNLGDPS